MYNRVGKGQTPLFVCQGIVDHIKVNTPMEIYTMLILFYMIYWGIVAYFTNSKIYQCAFSLLSAILTTSGSLLTFHYFNFVVEMSSRVGLVNIDDKVKIFGIISALYFVADKWASFIINLKNLHKKID